MKNRVIITGVLAVFMVLASLMTVHATTLTYNLNFEYSGDEPGGSPPWLVAIFDDENSAGSVQLTLDSGGLVADEFVGQWYFNVTESFLPDGLTFEADPGNAVTAEISVGSNEFRAGPDGYFDILFDFPQASGSRFGADMILAYTIFGDGLTAGSFAPDIADAAPPGGSPGPFFSAAHVQDIFLEMRPDGSGWIAAGPDAGVIPEPGTILLVGSGLIGLGLFGRRKNSA